jgi:glucokinase
LNPEELYIGLDIGGTKCGVVVGIVEDVLRKEALSPALDVCSIRPSLLGDSIGDYAALCVAVYEDKF